MSTVTVDAECGDCGGTGLYRGFAEPRDTAVVCLRCKGTGCAELEYTPFTGRREKRGVSWVTRSKGTFVATGVGPAGDRISYQDFREGRMP